MGRAGPSLGLALAALAGGTAAGYAGFPSKGALALGAAGAIGLCLRRNHLARWIAVAGVAFGLGALNASLHGSGPTALTVMASSVPRCELSGRVVESAGGLGTLLAVTFIRCEGFELVVDPGVAVLDEPEGEAGAAVRARGWLLPLGGDAFGRARERLGAHAVFDPQRLTSSPPEALPLAAAAAVREGLRDATASLERRRAGLLRGLAIGDTSGLDEETIGAFRRTGLSHLLAVSGSNVAIVMAGVALALRSRGIRARLMLALWALGLYVLVVGPEPSVLRAAAMAGVGLLALARGRRADALHALALAGIVVVALRPEMVFSVGLHLSAGATAGIVLWTGPLSRRLSFLPSALSTALAATVAAQLAVAPIIVSTFGELSLVAPLANLLAFPAVAPATVLSLVAGVVSLGWAEAGALVARLADPFAAWVLACAERFAAAPWASVLLSRRVGWALAAPVAVAAVAALRRRTRDDGGSRAPPPPPPD